MAKNNKRKENYFSRAIRDFGPNFVDEAKTAEMLSIEAPRIIRDMVLGKVQYEDYISYIVHPKMIAALIGYCNRKLQYYSICAEMGNTALSIWSANGIMITQEMSSVNEINHALSYSYSLLVQTLQYVDQIPDPQQLMIMTSKIHDYANYILKY